MKGPWLAVAIVAAMFVFAAGALPFLPDQIPTHWNAAGEVDAWAPSWPAALLPPGVGLAILALLWLLPKIDPRAARTAHPRSAHWTIGTLTLGFLALLHVFVLGAALGWPVDVPRLLIAATGAFFIAVGGAIPRLPSNWWFGIRTPWTLESEAVWRATHRLAGRTFTAGGLVTMGGAFAPEEGQPFVAMVGIAIAGFIPVVYSYVAWRRERRQA